MAYYLIKGWVIFTKEKKSLTIIGQFYITVRSVTDVLPHQKKKRIYIGNLRFVILVPSSFTILFKGLLLFLRNPDTTLD